MSGIPPTNTHARRILKFLRTYHVSHGSAPTYREIMAAVGLSSKDHVALDLRRLQASGYIKIVPNTARGIVILGASTVAPSVAGKPKRRKYPHGFCGECGIRCQTELCADCQGDAPLIQWHELAGEDRFYSNASMFRGAPTEDDTPKRHYRLKQTKSRITKVCECGNPIDRRSSHCRQCASILVHQP